MRTIRAKSAATVIIITIAVFSVQAQFNAIDAVTSASGRLVIKGGKAYATTADIIWNDFYSDGTQQLLKWGPSLTALANQKNLLPFTKSTDITTTITGLSAKTKYYFQFYRVYEGVTHLTNDSLTTFSATAVQVPRCYSWAAPQQDLSIDIYTLAGRLVRSLKTGERSDPISILNWARQYQGLAPGIYLIQFKEQGSGVRLYSMRQVICP
jgi:hypothetical protein